MVIKRKDRISSNKKVDTWLALNMQEVSKYDEGTILTWVEMTRRGMSYLEISKKLKIDESVIMNLCIYFETKYPLPSWAVQQIFRASGLLENICKHQIGHPCIEWLDFYDPERKSGLEVHGCCRCCRG